jgi:invasion protein IalB
MVGRQLRILRLWAWDARAASTRLAAIAAFAFLAVASGASAQTNAPDLVPLRPIFSSWVRLCSSAADFSARRTCYTSRDSRSEGGELIATVAIVEPGDGQPRYFSLKMPDGVALKDGAWLVVDRDEPWTAPAVKCMSSPASSGGYMAFCQVTTGLIERMKVGQVLKVQGTQANGKPLNVQVDLQGFASAYGGAAMEFKVFMEQRRNRRNEPQMRIRDDTLQPHLRPWN